MDRDWIAPSIAAKRLGYTSRYFVRHIMKRLLEYRVTLGPNGGPRYEVSRKSLDQHINSKGGTHP